MTSTLRHFAEAFPPASQGTILNSHRVIGIATNTSMMLNCTLVTYIMMTADCSLTSYPGHAHGILNVIPRSIVNVTMITLSRRPCYVLLFIDQLKQLCFLLNYFINLF